LFVEINWGSSVQAHTYRRALDATLKLGTVQEHVKNFRPQMLVLTGNPMYRPALVDLATLVTHGNSLMICGNVVLVGLHECVNTFLDEHYEYSQG
jgi:solute carrier family 12 (sodium/potassium/chloride transporter), member 2